MHLISKILTLPLAFLQLSFSHATIQAHDTLSLTIETIEDAIPGNYDTVDVLISHGSMQLGAFDMRVGFDADILHIQKAFPGTKLYGDSSYAWEYFTYRYTPTVDCVTGPCPNGTFRMVGIADINDPYRPTGFDVTSDDVLCSMVFRVYKDRHLNCRFLPIRFYWTDCGDISLLSRYRDTLLISSAVFDHANENIANSWDSLGYPTYFGAQATDCDSTNSKMVISRSLNLYNGGFSFACPETLDARGDINFNSIPFEIADAVVYTNYFIYGQSALPVSNPYPLSATDVNGDGIPLTLADLIYCIRLVVGDAQPTPPTDTVEIDYTAEHGTLSVDSPIGAAYAIISGNSTVHNLSELEMRSVYNATEDVTTILFYEFDRSITAEGDLLQFTGEIVYIELTTYDGAPVLAKRIRIPDEFVLLQNYPNPFNASTIFSFGLPTASNYKLTIYNTAGQVLETQTGTSEAGMVSLRWDAAGFASGVYFYRLEVGKFSESRKMILVK